jgi:FemAB-related protein (PEP-CTERM system-associated)
VLKDRGQSETVEISVSNAPDSLCEDFVRATAGSKLCHMPAWMDMIEKTFCHKGYYLVARENGTICGVLPLTHVRSRLFGNRMISQAFSNYGGPLAKSPTALEALCKCAVELAKEHRCQSIELRNTDPIPYDLYLRTDKVSMYLPLTADPDELWKSFRPQIRNRVRKAEKSGIVLVTGGLDLLDDFYRVWTVRMHQFGTPCYSRKLFKSIMETFPQNSRIFLARLKGVTVGAMFTYHFNGLVQVRWGAVLVEYNRLAPTSFLWWSIMKHFCLIHASCFDFGRTTVDTGPHSFKKRWGAKPIQLCYQYWTRPGHELSLAKPDNPKYENKVEMWKRLPLWMTRLVGPHISRNLP